MTVQELELPKGWVETNLDSISYIKNGFAFKSSQYVKSGVPLVRISNIQNDQINLKNEIVFLKKNYLNSKQDFLIFKDDILMALSGATTGKFAVFNLDEYALLNQRVGMIRTKNNECLIQKLLFYFFGSLQNLILRKAFGMAQPNISTNFLKSVDFLLPPLNEQKRIVSKIEELFSKIDSTKQLLEQTKLQLELYRQSLLQSAFEGKLVNNDSEDAKKIIDYLKIIENERKDEIFKHVLKNKKSEQYKFQEPRSYLEEEIPSISKKWHIASIETVCSLVSGGSTPLRTEEKNFSKTGFPLLKVENIPLNRGKIFLKNDQLRITKEPHNKKWQSKTYPNDVLINIVGPPLGKVGIVPENFPESNINQAIVLMRTVPSFLNKFLLYCLQSPQYYHFQIRLSTGVRQENIRKSLVGKFPIPIPSLEEQEQIVSQIEQGFSLIENTQRIVNSTLQTLQTMKMSVLKQAFEGKLVPQDPNDEPAEKLLERIKKEKS